jgi:hypothetical protein
MEYAKEGKRWIWAGVFSCVNNIRFSSIKPSANLLLNSVRAHRHGIANMYATEIINKYFYERTNPGKAQVYLD